MKHFKYTIQLYFLIGVQRHRIPRILSGREAWTHPAEITNGTWDTQAYMCEVQMSLTVNPTKVHPPTKQTAFPSLQTNNNNKTVIHL